MRKNNEEEDVLNACHEFWSKNLAPTERQKWDDRASQQHLFAPLFADNMNTINSDDHSSIQRTWSNTSHHIMPVNSSFQPPLRDSQAHHIYILSDKTAKWRYDYFLSVGCEWNPVKFVPFDYSMQDGEWIPQNMTRDFFRARTRIVSTRFGDLIIHHLFGDPDSVWEIEEAIINVVECDECGAGRDLDAVLCIADCDDKNSLSADSASITSLLHLRKLSQTFVTINLQTNNSTASSRKLTQDKIVKYLSSQQASFAECRFYPDFTGKFRYFRTSIDSKMQYALLNSEFSSSIHNITPVLEHWFKDGNEKSRVVTEVLDIDTDRILRNNPVLRSQ